MPEFLDKKKLGRGGLKTKVSRWKITSLTTLNESYMLRIKLLRKCKMQENIRMSLSHQLQYSQYIM